MINFSITNTYKNFTKTTITREPPCQTGQVTSSFLGSQLFYNYSNPAFTHFRSRPGCKVSRDKLDLRGYYYWTSHISIYIAKQKKYRERDTCYDKLFRLFRFMISPPKYAPK
uniref:Uncharacterized protein n=1 Tax=Rhizophagus irregularis (strain DAOM 181602 / DAOM 197198 / MUCL 43194) TaxID=747089 RepID=U9UXB1_RHIID